VSIEPVLKTLNVLRDMTSDSQGGVSYTSDQVTYPHDLERVPEDAYPSAQAALYVHRQGYAYRDDQISFAVRGNFRAFDQLILGDPNSVTLPVMANVDIYLNGVEKAGHTTLEVRFSADATPYGTAEDPRIRFRCEGHYDPAGTGDTRFTAVLEVDQHANVNVIGAQVTGGDGEIVDNSPAGFSLSIKES
jgi:hypothetical protein